MSRAVAYVGLGANLGDAARTLETALRDLSGLPGSHLDRVSSVWRSAPVGASGPDYLNAVARLSTALTPRELLTELHAIEQRHGRERPYPNAPRTLDLDLLLHGERCVDEPGLIVPHPRLHERAFVLEPLHELDSTLVVPGRGPVAALLPGVSGQRLQRLPG